MHAQVLAAPAAQKLGGAVGQHLVGVHVVRGAGASLVDVDDELIAKASGQHLVGGGGDRAGDRPLEAPEAAVRFSGRFLDEDGCGHQLRRRGQAADRKVLDRPLRLPAVIGAGGYAHLSQRVALDAVRGGGRGVRTHRK
jgi:hypothetical protein